uniref:Uncharacterized protein n=1 Tax=Macrostomum lignano TaxID=282301 RepID=A0A1I8FPZ1_9PLAT
MLTPHRVQEPKERWLLCTPPAKPHLGLDVAKTLPLVEFEAPIPLPVVHAGITDDKVLGRASEAARPPAGRPVSAWFNLQLHKDGRHGSRDVAAATKTAGPTHGKPCWRWGLPAGRASWWPCLIAFLLLLLWLAALLVFAAPRLPGARPYMLDERRAAARQPARTWRPREEQFKEYQRPEEGGHLGCAAKTTQELTSSGNDERDMMSVASPRTAPHRRSTRTQEAGAFNAHRAVPAALRFIMQDQLWLLSSFKCSAVAPAVPPQGCTGPAAKQERLSRIINGCLSCVLPAMLQSIFSTDFDWTGLLSFALRGPLGHRFVGTNAGGEGAVTAAGGVSAAAATARLASHELRPAADETERNLRLLWPTVSADATAHSASVAAACAAAAAAAATAHEPA